jgi:hypothetical protein
MSLQMTPAQKARTLNGLREAMAAVEALPTVTPCERCASFGPDGVCAVYRMPVPEGARAEGCAAWSEGVPF